jgi:hypothetical protein
MAAKADHDTTRHDLDLPAQGVARLLCRIDPADDLALDLRVQHPDLRAIGSRIERHRQLYLGDLDAAERDHVTADLHSEFIEQPFGKGSGCHPGRRFPRARPLQDVAGIQPIVLEHAGEVGMAGSGPGDPPPAKLTGRGGRLVSHHVFPVGPVAIGDQHGHRRAQGLARPEAGEPLDPVPLDLHPGAPAIALHSPGELSIDPLGRDGQAGRQALDDGDQGLAVRLACGGESEHRHSIRLEGSG